MVDQHQHGSTPGKRTWSGDDNVLIGTAAAVSAAAVAIANFSGISIGDDGVGYQAIADSLAAGHGLGYFLEDPVTVWPPLWPALMAFVSRITPFGTVGAAVVLNCIVAAMTVIIGNRLIRLVATERRLILAGTAVLTLGPATVGLGHVLMTDMAFTLVVLTWMIVLTRATSLVPVGGPQRKDSMPWLITAALLAWVAFGLRYIGLTLIAFGGLWLLFTTGRTMLVRIRNAAIYGVIAAVVPLAWMARNHSIDGTFTGERHTSARGLAHNVFDVLATVGRFLLPGVLNDATKFWAVVGTIGIGAALLITWRLLHTTGPLNDTDGTVRRTWTTIRSTVSTPLGLVTTWSVLYVLYMLYVRTTTALNILDLRLLFPAYFPMVIIGLALAQRMPRLGLDRNRISALVTAWAGMNVVAGLIATVGFGLGHSFFIGDYANDTFEAVRQNPVLHSIPDDCETYSNLPNALYPTVQPRGWSPQRTALESIDPMDDLERITRRSATHDVCLVWIDEPPVYWHLWSLEELQERLSLEILDQQGPVTVYLVGPPSDD